MKKLITMATLVMSMIATPVLAAPNDNANPRAFTAQHIIECRDHMQEMVASGEMTQEELKACIEQMKNSECSECLHQCEGEATCNDCTE